MAKMRGIKPETFTDDKILRLSPLARWLFIGMWTLACDNGHIEDNAVQLKVRILPIDNCDPEALIDELLATGQVVRFDGFLKVMKLTEHQQIDKRYLRFCEWCEHDVNTTFSPSDRTGRPKGAQRAHTVPTKGAQREHTVEGEGEGEGERESARADVEALCEHLASRIVANGSKAPEVGKRWHDAARLMLDKDQRDPEQAHRLIDWCQDSEFWRSNILSMPTFREKYDQLRLQAQDTLTPRHSESEHYRNFDDEAAIA